MKVLIVPHWDVDDSTSFGSVNLATQSCHFVSTFGFASVASIAFR
jgi:hypothetical protein